MINFTKIPFNIIKIHSNCSIVFSCMLSLFCIISVRSSSILLVIQRGPSSTGAPIALAMLQLQVMPEMLAYGRGSEFMHYFFLILIGGLWS